MENMKRRLEIEFDKYENLYELWEVFYFPKNLLYPTYWSNSIQTHSNKELLLFIEKRNYPDLKLKDCTLDYERNNR